MNAGYCPECQRFLHRKVWRIFPDGFECCSECVARLKLKAQTTKPPTVKADKPTYKRVRAHKPPHQNSEQLILQLLKQKPVMTAKEMLPKLAELNAPCQTYGHLVRFLRELYKQGKIAKIDGLRCTDPCSYSLPENKEILIAQSRHPVEETICKYLSHKKPLRIAKVLDDLENQIPRSTVYWAINQCLDKGVIVKEFISAKRFNIRLAQFANPAIDVNSACKNEVW